MQFQKKEKRQTTVRFDSHHVRLRTGEVQRKTGSYMYRWTDKLGKRNTIYAATLEDLREQEEQILVDQHDGIKANDMDDLIKVCVKNMVSENFTEEQARSYMKELLPTLDYWKKYDELSDNGQFEEFKKKLINEINELNVDGMPKVEKLNALVGKYVNLEYRLPNGQAAKFLNEAKTYLGNQLECEYGGDRCFGVVADMDVILICTYEENGKNPELVLYKKR